MTTLKTHMIAVGLAHALREAIRLAGISDERRLEDPMAFAVSLDACNAVLAHAEDELKLPKEKK